MATPVSTDRRTPDDRAEVAGGDRDRWAKQALRPRAGGALALDRVGLAIRHNALVTLLRRSGCGKSTLLNLVAGLLEPGSGEVRVQGRRVTGPGEGMVFQQHALFPWLTAQGNVFPIWTKTHRGMTAIDPVLFRAAQTMDQRGLALLLKVAVPAAMPDIATGVRVGWGLSFGVLVAAELIAAERGMGFMIMQARQLGEIGVVIFGIILIGATNLATDRAIGAAIRRRIGRWHAV